MRQSPTRVRLIDVANAAGVDRSVAGKVLLAAKSNTRVSEATAQRVREVARQLNYRPNQIARQLRGVRPKVLGTLIDAQGARVGYERLAAAERAAHAAGYRLMIGQIRADAQQIAEYLDDFQSRGIDGLLYLNYPVPPAIHPRVNLQSTVFITDPGIRGACFVELSRAMGVGMVVDHLMKSGRARPGLVLRELTYKTSHDRKHGFLTASRKHGLKDAASRVFVMPKVRDPGVGAEPLHRAIDQLLVRDRADCLVMHDDALAVEMMRALRHRGVRVPQDVAVVGFDNDLIGQVVDPALTTVDQCHDALAEMAVNLLVRLVEQVPVPADQRTVILTPRLVVRASG